MMMMMMVLMVMQLRASLPWRSSCCRHLLINSSVPTWRLSLPSSLPPPAFPLPLRPTRTPLPFYPIRRFSHPHKIPLLELPDSDGWPSLLAWISEERLRLDNHLNASSSHLPSIDEFHSINIGWPDREAKGAAAVLVCLFRDEDGRIRVLLTRRSYSLASHSGEVSLPGGKIDEEDKDAVTTALREAKEEIGLDPSLVKIATTMTPFISKNLLMVTPVIGLLSDKSKFTPLLNDGEVDVVFDAPLEMFSKQQMVEHGKWHGYTYQVHFFDYEAGDQKFVIWGLTAAILVKCASVIYKRSELSPKL